MLCSLRNTSRFHMLEWLALCENTRSEILQINHSFGRSGSGFTSDGSWTAVFPHPVLKHFTVPVCVLLPCFFFNSTYVNNIVCYFLGMLQITHRMHIKINKRSTVRKCTWCVCVLLLSSRQEREHGVC